MFFVFKSKTAYGMRISDWSSDVCSSYLGWDASGKGGIIRRMAAEWDPRYFEVWPISAPTEEECDRHFLWRFWQKLPGSQDINVFDRSWYGRVLEFGRASCRERWCQYV